MDYLNEIFFGLLPDQAHFPIKEVVYLKGLGNAISVILFHFKDDLQSVLRMLRVCLHFCFDFVDTLHFGDSVHEVVMKFLSRHYASLSSWMLDELKRRFGITPRFFYSLLLSAMISGVNNEDKCKFILTTISIFASIYIPSYATHKDS